MDEADPFTCRRVEEQGRSASGCTRTRTTTSRDIRHSGCLFGNAPPVLGPAHDPVSRLAAPPCRSSARRQLPGAPHLLRRPQLRRPPRARWAATTAIRRSSSPSRPTRWSPPGATSPIRPRPPTCTTRWSWWWRWARAARDVAVERRPGAGVRLRRRRRPDPPRPAEPPPAPRASRGRRAKGFDHSAPISRHPPVAARRRRGASGSR